MDVIRGSDKILELERRK